MFPKHLSAAGVQLVVFLFSHRVGLETAADLLAGPIAARRLRGLLTALSVPQPRLTRWIVRELLALQQVLSRKDIPTLDALAASSYALLDPADPVLAEIRLLTDGFTALLVAALSEVADFDVAA